ncbi:MAG: HAD family hydrolase [Planctomycetota bacterium]|jgi:putative hydrolase of the HAD superfamily
MPRIKGIKAVSFDGDDTLWDFGQSMRQALARTLDEWRRIDPKAPQDFDVARMIAIRDHIAAEDESRSLNLDSIRHESFRRALREAGRPDDALADRLNTRYQEERAKNVTPFDDVLPVLDALKGKFPLGVISNGNTPPENAGLDGVFQFVVFAEACGVAKPDPGIFETACRQAGCSSWELLHVGDSLEDDVKGARNAGARAVWLNRKGIPGPAGFSVELEIASLLDLPGML